MTVSLTAGTAVGGSGSDSLGGFENVDGSPASDSLTGSAVANRLNGQGGNDTVAGMAGDDLLVGAAGSDTLDGGAHTAGDTCQPAPGPDPAPINCER